MKKKIALTYVILKRGCDLILFMGGAYSRFYIINSNKDNYKKNPVLKYKLLQVDL